VSKQTIQTGIDGFRVVRDRVARDAGCEVEFEDTIWYDADEKEYKVWVKDEAPAACRVVLLKHSNATGRVLRYPAVLRTAAYRAMKDGKPTGQWRDDKQADHMIEKCCEAFATRRAFPNDFSGVYLEEEMQGHLGDEREQATARKVTAADIMQPNGAPADDVAEGEFVDEPDASDQGANQEAPPAPVTAQQVNALLKQLGYTVRDQAEVLHIATVIAGRDTEVTAVAELDATELGIVYRRLGDCKSRDDVVALLVQIAHSKGQPDSEPGGDA
jgi:hypothetical protein